MNAVEKVRSLNTGALDSNINKVLDIKSKIKKLNVYKRAYQKVIARTMDQQHLTKYDNGTARVSKVDARDVNRFNTRAFKKAHPRVYKKFITVSHRRGYLRIRQYAYNNNSGNRVTVAKDK